MVGLNHEIILTNIRSMVLYGWIYHAAIVTCNYTCTIYPLKILPIFCTLIVSITAPQDAHKRLVLQNVEWLTALLSGLARHELTIYITFSTGFKK